MNRDDQDAYVEYGIAAEALLNSPIVSITRHPAAYEFELADGRLVTLYPDGVEYPDKWEVETP